MKGLHLLFLSTLILMLSMAVMLACGDDDDDDNDDVTDDDTGDDDTGDDDDDCGPEDLCGHAVDCGYYATVDECTPWYDESANCADMDAYIDCNCDCMDTDPECGAWIDCGTICFNDLC